MGKVERARERQKREREESTAPDKRTYADDSLDLQSISKRTCRARVRPVTGRTGREREAREGPFKPLYLTSFPAFSKFQVRFEPAGRHVWPGGGALKNERTEWREIGGRCSMSTSCDAAIGHLHKQRRRRFDDQTTSAGE